MGDRKEIPTPAFTKIEPGTPEHFAFMEMLFGGPSVEIPEEVFALLEGIQPIIREKVCLWPVGTKRSLLDSVTHMRKCLPENITEQMIAMGLLSWIEGDWNPGRELTEKEETALGRWLRAFRKENPKLAASDVWVKRRVKAEPPAKTHS